MVPFTLIRKPWFWCIGQIDRKKCIKQWVLRSDRVDCEELTCFFWLAGLQVKWGCFQTIKPTWGFILAESLLLFFFFFVVVLRICGPADFPCRHAKKGSDEEGELYIDDGELHMETSQEADTAGLECKSGWRVEQDSWVGGILMSPIGSWRGGDSFSGRFPVSE